MQISNFNTTYFIWLLLAAGALVAVIFWPFMTAILIAGILAALFQRPYQWLKDKTGGRKGLSSFLMCLLILFIIIFPVVLVGGLVTKEIRDIYVSISENPEMVSSSIKQAEEFIGTLPIAGVDTAQLFQERNILGSLQSSGQVALNVLQKTYSGVTQFIFWLFAMFFSLFYFLIDGRALVRKFMLWSPMRDDQENLLIREFVSISRATLKGTFIIGLIQGTLAGILFAALGVASPVTWGVIMIILSIIPIIGAGLVWFPVGVYMILTGDIWQGVTILAFGFAVVSTIDNILRPKLVGRDTKMHPLLVFFATLGGIALFGIAGFIIGPIVVALFLALMQIYEKEFARQLKECNN